MANKLFCIGCRCTEDRACIDADGCPCAWASKTPPVCTVCTDRARRNFAKTSKSNAPMRALRAVAALLAWIDAKEIFGWKRLPIGASAVNETHIVIRTEIGTRRVAIATWRAAVPHLTRRRKKQSFFNLTAEGRVLCAAAA